MSEDSIEKEKVKLKNIGNSILDDYSNVNGLEWGLDSIFRLSESDVFKELIKDIERLETIYNTGNYFILSVPDDIAKDIPQIKYALDVMFPSKIYFILPKKLKGEIDIVYYTHLNEIILIIKSFNGEDNSHKKVFDLTHKIMALLYDFDKDIPFNEPDKDYFLKLKKLKWDNDLKNF